jgi:DNA-directed RNA polymerase specialized sigma24 family protein
VYVRRSAARRPVGEPDDLDFEAVWPDVRARVVGLLRSRGATLADAEDIAQEVAIRALREPKAFASREHLVRWCSRVAANLRVDELRRRRPLAPTDVPEVEGGHDTARTVERRLALHVLTAEIAQLSADERRLLFDAESSGSRREAVRLAVRRHRLRARLAAMVEGLLAAVIVLRRARPGEIARAAAMAVPIVTVLALPLVLPHSSPRSPERVIEEPTTTRAQDRFGTSQSERGGQPAPSGGSATGAPEPAAVEPTVLLQLQPAGEDVIVRERESTEDEPTLCTTGYVELCVDRPGPHVPEPDLPNLLPPL